MHVIYVLAKNCYFNKGDMQPLQLQLKEYSFLHLCSTMFFIEKHKKQ